MERLARYPVNVGGRHAVVVEVAVSAGFTSRLDDRELRGQRRPVAFFHFTDNLCSLHRRYENADKFRIDVVSEVGRDTGVIRSDHLRLGIHRQREILRKLRLQVVLRAGQHNAIFPAGCGVVSLKFVHYLLQVLILTSSPASQSLAA